MYETIQFIHSYWAYLTLLLIVLATLNALKGVFTKGDFLNKDARLTLFALIVTHIQVVIGLMLYMFSPSAMGAIKKWRNGFCNERLIIKIFLCRTPFNDDYSGSINYYWLF